MKRVAFCQDIDACSSYRLLYKSAQARARSAPYGELRAARLQDLTNQTFYIDNVNQLHTLRLTLIPATADFLKAELASVEDLRLALKLEAINEWPPEYYNEHAVRFMLEREVQSAPANSGWGSYYVVYNDSGKRNLVGVCGFKGAPDADGSVEIGYSIVASWRRLGIAKEAVLALLDWAFTDPRTTRVVAKTIESLPASIAVLLSTGFRPKGTFIPPGATLATGLRFELQRDA